MNLNQDTEILKTMFGGSQQQTPSFCTTTRVKFLKIVSISVMSPKLNTLNETMKLKFLLIGI